VAGYSRIHHRDFMTNLCSYRLSDEKIKKQKRSYLSSNTAILDEKGPDMELQQIKGYDLIKDNNK